MNYKYDEPGQQQPGQGQPYIIQIPFGQQHQPQQPEDRIQLTQSMIEQIHVVKMRNAHASARAMEVRMILDGMREVRDAINLASITVAEGDTGSKDRPPLEPSFAIENRLKLQNAYLRMTERLINYNEFFLGNELKVPLTNEIKKDQPKSE